MNDEFDNQIKNILKQDIEKPMKYEYTIKNFTYKKNDRKIVKKVSTIIATLLISSTVTVFGVSHIVKNKIWKSPKVINDKNEYIKEIENKVKEPISEEEKIGFISEDTALKSCNDILEILGYTDKMCLENIELIRDYDNNVHYKAYVNEILINLNPYTGKLEYFSDDNIVSKKWNFDEITDEKAKEIAIKTYSDLGILEDNFEISDIKKEKIVFNSIENDMWTVTFCDKYRDLEVEDSKYSTCFNVCDGKVLFYIIKGKENKNLELGKINILESEAVRIASNKEKEFSNLEISEITSELSIKKMNIFVYCLENNISDNYDLYKIDDVNRLVWVVEIKHNKDKKVTDTSLEAIKEYYNKRYFIDAETGEIIGGEQAEWLF